MKTVVPWLAAALCLFGSIAAGSLLLFLAAMLLIVYGLLNALDGMK